MWSVLPAQEVLDPSITYQILEHPFTPSSAEQKYDISLMIQSLTMLVNLCVPIMYGIFHDLQGLSYPHKNNGLVDL